MANFVSGLRRAYEERVLAGYDSDADSTFDPDEVSSASGSDSEDEGPVRSQYNFRRLGPANVAAAAQTALGCRDRIDSDTDETAADLVLNPLVVTPPSRFTRGLALLAIAITAVAGIYFGKNLFSENTAPVKELCDANAQLLNDKFGLQLSAEQKLTGDALEALDSAFTCAPRTEGVQGLVQALNATSNPLQGLFGIFKEAARNVSALVAGKA